MRITFDGFNGEDDQYIRLDGEPVGLLTKESSFDIWYRPHKMRVESYSVEFYEPLAGLRDPRGRDWMARAFHVEDGQARAALTRAKRYAREIIATYHPATLGGVS